MIMKIILSFILITYSLHLSAQKDSKESLWDLPCDSLTTQTEMNICSGEKVAKVDSIMISIYNNLLKHLTKSLDTESKLTIDKNDKIQNDYMMILRSQIKDLKASQDKFEDYKNTTLKIVSAQYDGGTMRLLAVNNYALGLIIDRIKLLKNLSDEMMH
jgi:uncharacterized protein YecT (DUF1311 family)